ncbi:MAG: endolytic transglycosylase MltG [Desulfotomaculum sp.]|nr:endolytic transglycosylase MltG [Desulfotomaculum sp.]
MFRFWKVLKRQSIRLVLISLVFMVIVIAGILTYGNSLLAPVNANDPVVVTVEIPVNSTGGTVAEVLTAAGLIDSALAFRWYASFTGLDSKIQPGKYQLDTAMSVPAILKKIINGSQVLHSFTIPEGYTVRQMAELLDQLGHVDQEEFLDLARVGDFQHSFLAEFPDTYYALEGYLFPDTYKIHAQASAADIINMMLNRFAVQAAEINLAPKAEELGISVHQAVTIAAMIEREAFVASDRAIISGVIHHRLRIGMPLQIDATVLYALGEHREVVLYKDLEVQSLFNTYWVSALPPGPIAAPGVASLKAAVAPVDTEYLFYVLRPDGSHAFSETWAGHQRNITKYL